MTEHATLAEMVEKAAAAAGEKRLDEAEALLEEILSRDGDNLRALDLFGFVRFFQERFDEGAEFCRRALALEPERAYALKGLGLCLARQGRLEEGRASLEQAIAVKPGWFDPYWDLAVVLTDSGRHQEALKVLARGEVNVPGQSKQFALFRENLKSRIKASRE